MRRVILGVAVAIMGMSMLLRVLFGAALILFTVWIAEFRIQILANDR